MKNNEITFGKYKGTSIEEIFESDRGYCEWLFGKYQADGSFKEVASEVGQFLRQERRLTDAEMALRRDALSYNDLAAMQNGDQMTEGQGRRFMALIESAVEAGIIEM